MSIEQLPEKMWVYSGDAHVLEPADLWTERMTPEMAERMPRSEKIDDRTEVQNALQAEAGIGSGDRLKKNTE